jgi:arginine decarboxylase
MYQSYQDYIEQTYNYLAPELQVVNNQIIFNGINTVDLAQKYGTPLKITYLPKISEKINLAKSWFNSAISKNNYNGKYHYCYCTKSSHFAFIINEAVKNRIGLETSSAYDIEIIKKLYSQNKISQNIDVICNGYKNETYLNKIVELVNMGFSDVFNIFDSVSEINLFASKVTQKIQVGLRVMVDEYSDQNHHHSRFGISVEDIFAIVKPILDQNTHLELQMLHFFVKTEGTRDNDHYWKQLEVALQTYCDLKKLYPTLNSIDIGGGLPAKFDLNTEIDHQSFIDTLISKVKVFCNSKGVPEPDIFSEFGSFTVAESGATIMSIIDKKTQKTKLQDDLEKTTNWNIIDSSFMTALPDIWSVGQKFPMLGINNLHKPIEKVILGGITCDSDDYYKEEKGGRDIYLPKFDYTQKQYIGFFHTGAYQETIGGFGGIQHCILPTPKHILIDIDQEGNQICTEFVPEQTSDRVLQILGF